MREIQILGTGCPKCEELLQRTEQAVKQLGIEYKLEKVEDIREIIKYGVVMTPALVVNGVVRVVGKVPSLEELKKMIWKS